MIDAKKLLAVALMGVISASTVYATSNDALVKEGRKVFVTKKLGNCLACHAVQGDPSIPQTGDIGPKLVNLNTYPKEYLFDKIWDPNKTNKNTLMPPMGRSHKITKHQIDALVAYLQEITKAK
ncbi:MAG: sulfur oxidation c-type cytochrome SoxX [Epsilonproteobacteria bacterium]|nr:sulfur oxidation c-type cytochrome SoxX [Campylobacterota bacterium]